MGRRTLTTFFLLLTASAVLRAQVDAAALPTHRTPLGSDAATVLDAGPNAFGYPAKVLRAEQRRAFVVGNSFFKDNWVAAPASTKGRDGLGPLFNARSCSSCHFRDGRGRAPTPEDGDTVTGFLLRLGVDGHDGGESAPDAPHPVYGGQLQDHGARPGQQEASFRIAHEIVHGRFADGEEFELLRPSYSIVDPRYGPLSDAEVHIGPRVAQQLIGLGLLEAVEDSFLLSVADPDDRDDDGISGRVNWITRPDGTRAIGRFGWKATQPTVREQSAAAFLGDMGITSSLFPEEDLTPAQRPRVEFVSGGEPEIDDHKLDRVAFYSLTLAVPAQRGTEDPLVLRGEEVFEALSCTTCHLPSLSTGADAVLPAYANRTFRAYTDLLLHDLGDELADEKHDAGAGPSEWRTPPLWGIGLFETVNGHTRYLHDGRARSLTEAILWHGGEAAAARRAFVHAAADERTALIAFLGSL